MKLILAVNLALVLIITSVIIILLTISLDRLDTRIDNLNSRVDSLSLKLVQDRVKRSMGWKPYEDLVPQPNDWMVVDPTVKVEN